jgi:hypothetical protein
VKRLLIVPALLGVLNGCGFDVDHDVRAYNTCLSRHPQDAVVCEGPRQAYELDPAIVQARSAGGESASYGLGEGSEVPGHPLAPVPPDPSPKTDNSDPSVGLIGSP